MKPFNMTIAKRLGRNCCHSMVFPSCSSYTASPSKPVALYCSYLASPRVFIFTKAVTVEWNFSLF